MLADFYAARNKLETELGPGEGTANDGDQIDASMAEYLAGYQAYQDGDFTEAEVRLAKSASLLEWNILALLNLGNLYFLQGLHDKAEQSFSKALLHAEGDARSEILTNLGMCALKMENISEAGECFHQAIDLDPGNALALNDMGLVKEMEGNEGEALEYYKAAIKADLEDDEIWYNLGTLLGKQGNKEGRLYCFMKAEELGFAGLKELIDDLVDQGIKPVNPLA